MIIYVFTWNLPDGDHIGRGIAENKQEAIAAVHRLVGSHNGAVPGETMTPKSLWVFPIVDVPGGFADAEAKAKALHDREEQKIREAQPDRVGAEERFDFPNKIFENPVDDSAATEEVSLEEAADPNDLKPQNPASQVETTRPPVERPPTFGGPTIR
jgi:hypothetical protein